MIQDNSYIHIGGRMLNNLKLKGNELIVYATIYSFTNGTDDHCFHGSAGYLAERCGIDKRSIYRILKKLEVNGFIMRKEREDNGIKFVDYYTPCDTSVTTSDKMSVGGSDKMSHHNNSYLDNDTARPKRKKPSRVEYVCAAADVREVVDEQYINTYATPLKILLIMIKDGFKVEKTKEALDAEIKRLKEKAEMYNIKRPDGQIARQSFLQAVDKRSDWHKEKNKPVKNFRTSITPFISKIH